jgi:hypothetical protein
MTDSRTRLDEILKTMELPPGRLNDLRWVAGNIGFRNAEHEHFREAVNLLLELAPKNACHIWARE